MKKSTIVLAIATALSGSAVAQADTTLYGSARISVDYEDIDLPEGSGADDPDANWDVVNNLSRLGVQGSEDLGGGLSAIYQYEFGVDVTEGGNFEGNRPKWVGLKGGFGSATLGTQWTPYYNLIGMTDFFNSVKTFDVDVFLYPNAASREANSLVYKTPDLAGFSGEGMVIMDGANNEDNVDRWNVMGKYQNGPFTAGLTYAQFLSDDGDDDTDLFGLGLGLQIGDFTVNFTHEQGDASTVYGDASNYLLLAAYTIGNTTLAAEYGYIDPDDGDHVDYFVAGVQHNLSKRTSLIVEYIGRRDDNPASDIPPIGLGDRDAVSIGMRHDF